MILNIERSQRVIEQSQAVATHMRLNINSFQNIIDNDVFTMLRGYSVPIYYFIFIFYVYPIRLNLIVKHCSSVPIL